jgi:hypothetical protein
MCEMYSPFGYSDEPHASLLVTAMEGLVDDRVRPASSVLVGAWLGEELTAQAAGGLEQMSRDPTAGTLCVHY